MLLLALGWACSRLDLERTIRPSPTYERDIKPHVRPALHGLPQRDEARTTWTSRAGWPSIRSRESWRGRRAKVIVPGQSAESELVRRLADPDEDRRMPLQDKPLPDDAAGAGAALDRRRSAAGDVRWRPAGDGGRRFAAAPAALGPLARSRRLPSDVKLAAGA